MKLRLVILDTDEVYIKRFVEVINNRFRELELYSFTELDIAMDNIKNNKLDVFLASTDFDIDPSELPTRCAFAYFTTDNGIQSYKGQKAVCKFQKAEYIYRAVVGLYAEVCSNITERIGGNSDTRIIVFSTPAGGTGNSVVAASCATFLAKQNKKVLYLNLESMGTTDCYFDDEGHGDFSDVIYALKSKNSNVAMKIKSVVRTNANKVKFIASCGQPMDRCELTAEDVHVLFEELSKAMEFEYVVVDSDFSLNGVERAILECADDIVVVSDGNRQTNRKIDNAVMCLKIMDEEKGSRIADKIKVCYNRFSNKSGVVLTNDEIQTLGGIQRYKDATIPQLMDEISGKMIFNRFIEA